MAEMSGRGGAGILLLVSRGTGTLCLPAQLLSGAGIAGSGYSSPYSPRVAKSMIRSRALAVFVETLFIFANIGSYCMRLSGHEHVFG